MADFHLSVLSGAVAAGPVAGSADTDLVRALRAALSGADGRSGADGPSRWQVADSGALWCSAQPVGVVSPAQGWKLHLSATPHSAHPVLQRALPVLLAGDSGFKFARSTEQVAQLNARHTPRGHSGKFLTVYPSSDAEAVRLAAELHRATAGLPGPQILSDRPYAPGSLVHYRYGAFVEERRISNDGLYAWVILDPDGNPVEDRRIGRYVPPSWARSPFPDPAPTPDTTRTRAEAPDADPRDGGGGVLLGGRFRVREAIRHLNKGGVYRGVDVRTGAAVILKEARPHVATDASGRDVRDLLRAEARALELLADQGIAPRPVALFEEGGHLFLAEDLIPGTSLREWVLDRIRAGGWLRNVPEALDLAERLAGLLAAAHRAGLVVRDLTPNNVMVRPDGALRLIDLELAVPLDALDEAVLGAGTPGYAAREQFAGARPCPEADLFSLGACLCFLITGSTPELLAEEPPDRPERERLAEWLGVRVDPQLPPQLPDLILALMDPDPARRPGPEQVARIVSRARLDQAVTGATVPGARVPGDVVPAGRRERWDEAIAGLVEHLLATMRPDDPDRLWPVSCTQGSPDPCIVQLGAAGVLGPLTRYLTVTGDPQAVEAVATVAAWTERRIRSGEERPPGLYFGQAGIAWALHDAGRALGDVRLQERALDLAAVLPTSSPNPDVTHGTAGIGMALLHLGRAAARPDLLARADAAADVLVAGVEDGPDGLIWGTPAAFDSRLAGGRFYGFAHGTAGVATFLLATGRPDCRDLARRAGETLLSKAVVGAGVAQWGPGPGDPTTAPYWCHGASGIGTFLIRLHQVTGDERFAAYAGLAAAAVRENASRGVLGQCHGLAGNGEFLLDLADRTAPATAGARYRELAARLAAVILAGRARRGPQLVFPDEEGGTSPTWADGAAGILSFLLRLRHGGPRPWTAEPADLADPVDPVDPPTVGRGDAVFPDSAVGPAVAGPAAGRGPADPVNPPDAVSPVHGGAA